jgi:hypothetical protein
MGVQGYFGSVCATMRLDMFSGVVKFISNFK